MNPDKDKFADQIMAGPEQKLQYPSNCVFTYNLTAIVWRLMDKLKLIESLEKSPLFHAGEAVLCLRNGSVPMMTGGPVQIDALIDTFSVRQENLKRLASAQKNDLHLSALYNSVSEFLDKLKQHKTLSCVWIDVAGQPPVTYLIPVLYQSEIPLGCMAVIPKTKPSP